MTAQYARTIGVAVDHRRRNHSEESLAKNTLRLKEYLSKLILFPLKGGVKPTKQGPVATATADQLKNVSQNTAPAILAYSSKPESHEAPRDLTKDEKTRKVYQFLRAKSRDEKVFGLPAVLTSRTTPTPTLTVHRNPSGACCPQGGGQEGRGRRHGAQEEEVRLLPS